jgi:hypothetical protein
MSVSLKLVETTRRLATVVSIIRTQAEDVERRGRHDSEIAVRVEEVVARLEKTTADLERAIV